MNRKLQYGDVMLTIDGSQGEGGGQILRSALALSMVTGTPFRIENIRAKRPKPGLLRQHLTAVTAAVRVSNAEVTGASLGSRELEFRPQGIVAGEYHFAIGSAGSTTLVLQTVLPALMVATGASTVVIEGGTHNPYAPPVDFLQKAFLPLIGRMGPQVALRLERHGFFPAGGGRICAKIQPAPLRPLELLERGEIRTRLCRAMVAGLDRGIAARELAVIRDGLNWSSECFEVEEIKEPQGRGNIVMVELISDHVTEVFTGFGMRGIPSEAVAGDALQEAKDYLAAGVPIGTHLADQLLLPLALAGGGSFATLPLTRHSTTNIEIIQKFLPIAAEIEREERRGWRVTLRSPAR